MKWLLVVLVSFNLLTSRDCCSDKQTKDNNGFIEEDVKVKKTDFSKECLSFIKKELKGSWKLHESGQCYFESEKLRIAVMTNQACFIGQSYDTVKQIFGEPNLIQDTPKKDYFYALYYMGKRCENLYPYWNFQFIFDLEKKLVRIGMNQTVYD